MANHFSRLTQPPGPEPFSIADGLQLFLDEELIAARRGLERRLHSPRIAETALPQDRPWGDETMYDPVVIKEGDRYRMWYRTNFNTAPFYTGYAESQDGLSWTKPAVGRIEFRGSKENNLVWSSALDPLGPHTLCIFRDGNPRTPADQRYKAIAPTARCDGIVGLVSPDGWQWRMLQAEPIITGPKGDNAFDSHNVAFWDGVQGHFVAYLRGWQQGRRAIRRSLSTDFRKWSPLEYLDLGKAAPEHLYKNAATPYYRRPDIVLMFPKRFVPGRKFHRDWAHGGLSDIVFMSSRDGLRFERGAEAFIRPGRDPGNWHERAIEVGPGLVPTGNGEMSLYLMEHYRLPTVRIRRAVLREDGFVSMNASAAGGAFTTRPVVFRGSQLALNYATSAAGSVRVELQDAQGKPLPGLALNQCPEIFGDELARVVSWAGVSDLGKLAGRPVRLRFTMQDADLFSFRFQAPPAGP